VERDLIAVGVGEGERPTEGAVDRCGDDGVTVGDQSIVYGLDVGGMEPDRGADAGLGNGWEVGAGDDVAECERDRLGLEMQDTAAYLDSLGVSPVMSRATEASLRRITATPEPSS
jgi:hypothetical protein